jgi:hypothetical protein
MHLQTIKTNTLTPRNLAVLTTYQLILKTTKQLLATIEDEQTRHTLIREDRQPITVGTIVHEFINPMFYLRLECYADNQLGIHYGIQSMPGFLESNPMTMEFVRMIYKLTMASSTDINIEDCILTDYMIIECSDLFEYIEERQKSNHMFSVIPYKPKGIKRKLRKAA